MRNSYFQDPLDPSRRYGRVCASLAPRWSRRFLRVAISLLHSSIGFRYGSGGGNRHSDRNRPTE